MIKMNEAPIYDYQELVIEEMRKELINQDQYIGKLTESYQKEIKRLNNITTELEKKIISICDTCYEDRESSRIKKWIKELKEEK